MLPLKDCCSLEAVTYFMAKKKPSAETALVTNNSDNREGNQRYVQMARKLQALYLNQDRLLPEMGLSKAVWRILLEVYIAKKELRNVCVSRIPRLTNIPSTTSIRTVEYLVKNDLLVKSADPLHASRRILHLTDHGFKIVHGMISDFIKSLKD